MSFTFASLLAAALLGTDPFIVPETPCSYLPMDLEWPDPKEGGFTVGIGNGAKVGPMGFFRSFPVETDGKLTLSVQYQVKLPVGYGPGHETCRVVVQSTRAPNERNPNPKIDHEIPLTSFLIVSGGHVNEVVLVSVPPPISPEDALIRVVLETLDRQGHWESMSVKTYPLLPNRSPKTGESSEP